LSFLTINTDGAIEPLDALRVCYPGATSSHYNVANSDLTDVLNEASLLRDSLMGTVALAKTCEACAERRTCGGGAIPHRYSAVTGFRNPSVWCKDIIALLTHIRGQLHA
jgi:uncharacterized protein